MTSTAWRTSARGEPAIRVAVTLAVLAAAVGVLMLAVYRWEWFKLTRGTRPQQFLWALWTTAWISGVSLLLSVVFGIAGGLARLSRKPVWNQLGAIYVEVIRGTPLLVQVMLGWYVVSPVLGTAIARFGGPVFLEKIVYDPYVVGVIVLSVFSGAYVTEIVRAAIQSVDKGQTEAALSQGMTQWQVYRLVIFPQALKRMIPPLTGQFANLIKDSSLLMLIPGIVELTKRTSLVRNSIQKSHEPLILVAILYFAICFPLSRMARRMELRLAE